MSELKSAFDASAYGRAVADLLVPPRFAALGPGTPNEEFAVRLQAFDIATDLGGPLRDRNAALACSSGLWLYHDFLDRSHAISQDLETPEGSFWHAILHRREPDPSNSKYWWRKVGGHPVLDRIVEQAPRLGYRYTSPLDFVDFCERVRGSNTPDEILARKVQHLEWQTLFHHCYTARGSN